MYITTYFYFDTKKILVILQMQFILGEIGELKGYGGS